MKPLTIEVTKSYIACANCGEGISSHAHITTPQSTKWTCDACNSENHIVFGEGGAVTSVSLTGNGSIMGAGLMISANDRDDPIFLFIDVPFYAHDMKDGKLVINDDLANGKEYYYDSHTCPTNWIQGQVRKIVYQGDDDPHGVFQLIGLWDKATLLKHIEDADTDHAAVSKYVWERYQEIHKVVLTLPPITIDSEQKPRQLMMRSALNTALLDAWTPSSKMITGIDLSAPWTFDPTACYPANFTISNSAPDFTMMTQRMDHAKKIETVVKHVVADFFTAVVEPSDEITNLQTAVDAAIKSIVSVSPELWLGYSIGVQVTVTPEGLTYIWTPDMVTLLSDDTLVIK